MDSGGPRTNLSSLAENMGMGTVNKLEYRRAVRERLATGRPARISATDGLDELARSVSENTASKQIYRQRVAEAAGVKVASTSSGSSTPSARPVSTATAATAATTEDKANLSWIWWISLFVSVISMFIGLWYVSLFGLVGSIVAVRGAASKGHPVAAGCLVAFSIFAFLISFVVGLFRSFTGGY